MKSNRQPCKNFLKGTSTKLLFWHPPECQFYKSETGCKFGAECSSQGIKWHGQRKRYLLPVESKRLVFERRLECRFRHESKNHTQKPEHKAATPSEPSVSRGRSVSRKRSIRGKSNHGAILRQPCRYYLRGNSTRTSCGYWLTPECQFYKTETGCKAGDKCMFLHHKVDEQPNKKPKKG